MSPFVFVAGDPEAIVSRNLLFHLLKIFLNLDKKRRGKEE
jgi:hypothetical protein